MSRLVSVLLSASGAYQGVRYAFRTSKTVSEGDSTVLGHQALTGADTIANLIFKAQTPKPARASRRRATGYTSSFVSATATVSAANAGWQITPSRRDGGRRRITQFTVVVYVTLNGIKYGWNIRKSLFQKIKGSLTALGVQVATPQDDIVFGASFPKPPKVTISVPQGADILTSSSFYDPSREESLSANFATTKGRHDSKAWTAIAR
jgi:hypothetical protein